MIETAAILSGGLGKRLGPLTASTPKSMVRILGKPFVDYKLTLLREAGIKKVVFCVGHLSAQIKDYVGKGKRHGVDIEYSDDGEELLGTGGALQKALPLLGENFFLLYGDSYLPCNYSDISNHFIKIKKDGFSALMTVLENNNQWDKSNIVFKEGKIISYDKTHTFKNMTYIDYGLSILTQKAFKLIDFFDKRSFDLQVVYQKLIKNKEMAGYEVFNRFYEVGSLSGIKELEEYLSKS